jgi:hypothetical protein
VVKLADTPDLGSGAARCEGSSPFLGNFPNVFLTDKRFGYFSLFSKASFIFQCKRGWALIFSIGEFIDLAVTH